MCPPSSSLQVQPKPPPPGRPSLPPLKGLKLLQLGLERIEKLGADAHGARGGQWPAHVCDAECAAACAAHALAKLRVDIYKVKRGLPR